MPDDGGVRSRATAFDVIRAPPRSTGIKVIVVENLVEMASWELFDWWLAGVRSLGYTAQILCVSAAHIGDDTNSPAPQWRDRMYVVFTRDGIPTPTSGPGRSRGARPAMSPTAPCRPGSGPTGGRSASTASSTVYRCPNTRCRNTVGEPLRAPRRLGDRLDRHQVEDR